MRGGVVGTRTKAPEGWVVEHDVYFDFGEESVLIPAEGTKVAAVLTDLYRTPGSEDEWHEVKAGEWGTVIGYVAEWFQAHVQFDMDRDVWVDFDLLDDGRSL